MSVSAAPQTAAQPASRPAQQNLAGHAVMFAVLAAAVFTAAQTFMTFAALSQLARTAGDDVTFTPIQPALLAASLTLAPLPLLHWFNPGLFRPALLAGLAVTGSILGAFALRGSPELRSAQALNQAARTGVTVWLLNPDTNDVLHTSSLTVLQAACLASAQRTAPYEQQINIQSASDTQTTMIVQAGEHLNTGAPRAAQCHPIAIRGLKYQGIAGTVSVP